MFEFILIVYLGTEPYQYEEYFHTYNQCIDYGTSIVKDVQIQDLEGVDSLGFQCDKRLSEELNTDTITYTL